MKKFLQKSPKISDNSKKGSNSNKLGVVKIFTSSLKVYRQNFWRFTITAAVVLLVSSIIKAYDVSVSKNSDVMAILYIAGLYAFAALVWLNFSLQKAKTMRLTQIYVTSSGRFFPLLFVSIAQALMVAPAVVGFFLLLLSVSAGLGWWLGIIGGLLVVLSAWLLVRYSIASVIAVAEAVTGMQALRRSHLLTKKRFWRLVGSYLAFLLVIGFASGLVLELFIRLPRLSGIWFFQGLINGLLLSVIMPLLSIFACNLYRVLDEKSKS